LKQLLLAEFSTEICGYLSHFYCYNKLTSEGFKNLTGIFDNKSSVCEGPKPKLIKISSAFGFLESSKLSTDEQWLESD
jgi:hypothetical protein